MNRLPALAASAAAAFTLGVVAAPAATASCVGPSITVSPKNAGPGDQVTVTGAAFGTDCNDAGATVSDAVLGDPAADIDLVLNADGTPSTLVTVDADADYAFTQRVTLPADVTGHLEIYATLADGYNKGYSTRPATLTLLGAHPSDAAPSPANTDVARPDVVQTDSPPKDEAGGTVLLLGGAGAIALTAAAFGIRRTRRNRASNLAH